MAQLNDLVVTGKSRFLNKISGSCTNGTTVSSQSQTTKFLREDGEWAAPSYTTNTNTTYTLGTSSNTITLTPSSGSVQSITAPYATSAGSAGTATTAGNVTGTVAIAHGGTGATTRLGAAKALTDETVATPGFVVGLTDSWGSFGYTSIANLKTTIGSAAAASGGTAITMCTTGEKYIWNNKLNLSGGTMTGAIITDISSSNSALVPDTAFQGCIGSVDKPYQAFMGGAFVALNIYQTNTKILRVKQSDITFDNLTSGETIDTWDGTNTSLKDAVGSKATILAETIPSLTFSSGVATLAKKTGYILINIYPYDRNDNGYGITSFTEQKNGSYQIRNNTTNLSASLAARAIWLKV